MPLLASPGTTPTPGGYAPAQIVPNTYTYCATDLITGEVLADSVPLTVQSFSRQISASGDLIGSLSLQDNLAVNQPYIEALEATRCMLWVLQNGFPVWAGIVWDWPHSTIMPPATLPIQASSLESLFDHRMVTDTIDYEAVDIFTVFADMVRYGTSKNSPYIVTGSPAINRLPALATDAMRVAALTLPDPSVTAGVPWTATYLYSDLRKVSDVWTDLLDAANMEYTFEPGFDANGNFAITVRLGYTQLGAPAAESGLVFTFPGNVVDYGYPRTGSQSANAIWATAPPNGSLASWQGVYPHGFDLTQLQAGYPLLEDTISWDSSTVTSQDQINQYADSQVQLRTQQMTLPQLVIGGAGQPSLQEVILGDSAWFSATSGLHPPQGSGPGLTTQVRIAGWTLTPPSPGQPEQLTISAGGVLDAI